MRVVNVRALWPLLWFGLALGSRAQPGERRRSRAGTVEGLFVRHCQARVDRSPVFLILLLCGENLRLACCASSSAPRERWGRPALQRLIDDAWRVSQVIPARGDCLQNHVRPERSRARLEMPRASGTITRAVIYTPIGCSLRAGLSKFFFFFLVVRLAF